MRTKLFNHIFGEMFGQTQLTPLQIGRIADALATEAGCLGNDRFETMDEVFWYDTAEKLKWISSLIIERNWNYASLN